MTLIEQPTGVDVAMLIGVARTRNPMGGSMVPRRTQVRLVRAAWSSTHQVSWQPSLTALPLYDIDVPKV